ncbi:MAG: 23S rRNA (pseudouridine(1915)-N(3))-methyltransferase RlmH [Elusimicrobia bacterium]|nr:23S rRNA (pseudouridine(1915)-N(3))-methyltransferase RlmH [Elusimicrobiota bacterium]
MQIQFCLDWLKAGVPGRRAFKMPAAFSLFEEYRKRISAFAPCEISAGAAVRRSGEAGIKIWVCDRGQNSREVSSEALAALLEKTRDAGAQQLRILIDGPDGISKDRLTALKADLVWSFGPMTLPHELAAVVACEQIYRACTILRRTPYHLGH